MGGWTLEWSEGDPTQCWVELLSSWLTDDFKASLQFNKGASNKEECGAARQFIGTTMIG